MSSQTLKALRAQKARIDAQLKRKAQLALARDRKRDTRRKILVGALVLGWLETDAVLEARIYQELDLALTRAVDRAVFAGKLRGPTAKAGR